MSITRQNLSVIIVSYKSDHVIENCINSIDSEIEIIVIDNSNNEQFKKKIETKYKNVKCILSKENLGMGAGNNLGIKNVNNDFALILNPDVSLEKDSTCWNSWQENLKQTLKGGEIFGSEQLAMNMSVYVDNVETEFLPLNCNWITSNLLPKFDEDKDTWVEPYLPNYKIGIMHLAAGIWKDNEDMRLNKNIKIDIQTLTGKILNKSLRFNN